MKYLIFLIMTAASVAAATLNVPSTNYPSVQVALDAAQAGDVILLGADTDPTNTAASRRGGTSESARIIIDGQGIAAIKRISIGHPYITVRGLTLTGMTGTGNPTTNSPKYKPDHWQHFYVNRGAHYLRIEDVEIDAERKPYLKGVEWVGPSTRPFGDASSLENKAASNCYVNNLRIRRTHAQTNLQIFGDDNVFENMLFTDAWQADDMRIWGRRNIIRNSVFDGNAISPVGRDTITTEDNIGYHIDWVQTFGENGNGSRDHVIEKCIVRNSAGQLMQISSDTIFDIGGWTIRNCIFENIAAQASVTVPDMKFYNNVFYKVDNAGAPLSFGSRSFEKDIYPASGSLLPNILYRVKLQAAPSGTIAEGVEYLVSGSSATSVTYNGIVYKGNQTFIGVAGVPTYVMVKALSRDNVYINGTITYNGQAYLFGTSFLVLPDGPFTYTKSHPSVLPNELHTTYASNTEVLGNVFFDCGGVKDNVGWYAFNTTRPPLTGLVADYNFVARGDFTAKRRNPLNAGVMDPGYDEYRWYEPNGFNGGNPFFVDAFNSNFQITGVSPLIDTAPTIAGVTEDLLGNSRPVGVAPDIGAYEYTGGEVVLDYYVATTGNDANPGTEASPFLTIQHAVNTAGAGQIINIAAGSYPERVTTAANGTATNPVRIRGEGVVTMKGFVVNNPYHVIEGITITGNSAASESAAHIEVGNGGDYLIVRDCTIRGGRSIVRSDIQFNSGSNTITSATGGFSSIGVTTGDTIRIFSGADGSAALGVNTGPHTVSSASDTSITVGTTLTNVGPSTYYLTASYQYALYLNTGTTGCKFENNTWEDTNFDCWWVTGSNHTFTGNLVTGTEGWDNLHFGGSGHVFRDNTFRDSPYKVYQVSPDVWENTTLSNYSNILFENNWVENVAAVVMSQKGSGTSTGLLVRNNVFVDVGGFSLTHPNTNILNNTMLRVGAQAASPVIARSQHAISVDETGGASGVQIIGNAFIDCGRAQGLEPLEVCGWYQVTGEDTFYAAYNYVTSPGPSWAAKTGWPESAGLNGGDPSLANILDMNGADDLIFTSDDGARPLTGSKLIDSGFGGADIGAYSVTTEQLAPLAPSGLTTVTISAYGIQLTWTDNSNNETGFEIQRSADNVSWVTVSTQVANTTGWTNNGLENTSLYYFRVRATNTVGPSAWSNVDSTTTGSTTPERSATPRLNPTDVIQ